MLSSCSFNSAAASDLFTEPDNRTTPFSPISADKSDTSSCPPSASSTAERKTSSPSTSSVCSPESPSVSSAACSCNSAVPGSCSGSVLPTYSLLKAATPIAAQIATIRVIRNFFTPLKSAPLHSLCTAYAYVQKNIRTKKLHQIICPVELLHYLIIYPEFPSSRPPGARLQALQVPGFPTE